MSHMTKLTDSQRYLIANALHDRAHRQQEIATNLKTHEKPRLDLVETFEANATENLELADLILAASRIEIANDVAEYTATIRLTRDDAQTIVDKMDRMTREDADRIAGLLAYRHSEISVHIGEGEARCLAAHKPDGQIGLTWLTEPVPEATLADDRAANLAHCQLTLGSALLQARLTQHEELIEAIRAAARIAMRLKNTPKASDTEDDNHTRPAIMGPGGPWSIIHRKPRLGHTAAGAEWALIRRNDKKDLRYLVATITQHSLARREWCQGTYWETYQEAASDYNARE